VSLWTPTPWYQRLPKLLKVYEAWDIYNADETALFYNCVPNRMLTFRGETYRVERSAKELLMVLLFTNSNYSDK
jgi:hypothetical protein